MHGVVRNTCYMFHKQALHLLDEIVGSLPDVNGIFACLVNKSAQNFVYTIEIKQTNKQKCREKKRQGGEKRRNRDGRGDHRQMQIL